MRSAGGRRTIRFQVPSGELLDGLAVRPLPVPGREEGRSIEVFRDVYYDTAGGELGLKPAAVRLRHHADGRRTLRVDIRSASDGEGAARSAESDVEPGDAGSVFHGDSEAAELLRGLIDPARLEQAFEVETLCRLRHVSLSGRAPGSGQALTLSYDALTVRRNDLSGTLWEIVVTAAVDADVEALVTSLEREPGVRITLSDPATRARDLLDDAEIEALEREVRAARELAIVAHAHGRIALLRDGGRLRIPFGDGSGETAARRLVSKVLAAAGARVRLLGTNPGGPGRPALEVWATDEVQPDTADGELVWVPLAEALGAVGSAALRGARTLAALEVAARSDLLSGDGAAELGEADAGPEALELALSPVPLPEAAPGKDVPPAHLLNAELSRVSFDERILAFAESGDTPLLERVRFLSMFGSRQDDFFMTRVAGFKEEAASPGNRRTMDGLSAREQLDLIGIRARQVAARAQRLLQRRLLPALAERGVRILRWRELGEEDRAYLLERYATDAEVVLTPMAADASHPFPHMRNLRPAIGAVVRLPGSDRAHFTAVELPGELPRFLPLEDGRRLVPLEELLVARLPDLYSGLTVQSAHLFRVTRSARTQLEETLVGDVLQAVEEDVARRPFRSPVRLEVDARMPRSLRQMIVNELRYESPTESWWLGPQDVYVVDGLIDLAALEEVAEMEIGDDVRFPPMHRSVPLEPRRPVFDLLREADRLVYFPDDDFTSSAERFVREAAEDPDVVALKVTLYRTDSSSEIVQALSRAREMGKDAVALIEIKASFDEQQNIAWAKSLSAAGIHVVFSPLKYKVHAKAGLVVRREGDELVRYSYIGTGNLNAATARTYTDVALLTSDPEIGEELQAVFNILTGYSATGDFDHLLVSPFNMRQRFLRLIDREIDHARAGRPAGLRGQLNGLADRRMIAKLYEASHAGVPVELAVREICALRPGVPGLSENIRIVSLLGRLLQHARIFEFANGGAPEYFIGSADWRPRNLSRRVEVAVPVRRPELGERLREILDGVLHAPDLWELRPDGAYVQNGAEVVGGGTALRALRGLREGSAA